MALVAPLPTVSRLLPSRIVKSLIVAPSISSATTATGHGAPETVTELPPAETVEVMPMAMVKAVLSLQAKAIGSLISPLTVPFLSKDKAEYELANHATGFVESYTPLA
jgi:hypothetical protein